jgi:aerobic-type carbon monoxide dehydrogenase small subunit (CoxS/CutS family)
LVGLDTPVTFSFNGVSVQAVTGRNLAAVLLALGHRTLRASPGLGAPRGVFCMMGVCQECVVWVDGRRAPACRTLVRDGLTVSTGEASA